jgi:hypothetical protein
MYHEPRKRAQEVVHERIREKIAQVLPYSDFLVLDQRLAVTVQPAVPIRNSYATYWPFRPDRGQTAADTAAVIVWLTGRRGTRAPCPRRDAGPSGNVDATSAD